MYTVHIYAYVSVVSALADGPQYYLTMSRWLDIWSICLSLSNTKIRRVVDIGMVHTEIHQPQQTKMFMVTKNMQLLFHDYFQRKAVVVFVVNSNPQIFLLDRKSIALSFLHLRVHWMILNVSINP